MPDISMCTNMQCSYRNKCYRYMAVPNDPWQSYGSFLLKPKARKCDSFMKINKGDRIRQ